jgi:DNA modification methylase
MQKIIHGDCLIEMRKMADNSIDFIVTDSPYGISFMGKDWDQSIPPIEYWREMLRVCKPGAMMACAGLPRMYHRLTCVVEDAGWEIRDCIMHVFGSGFPKSLDVSKAIDKANGCKREVLGRKEGERYKYEFKSDFNEEDKTSRLGRGDAGLLTIPSHKLAKQFSGYGTALKPAYEPWLIAMKPLDGTFAQNAEKWGVAGINIDESRILTSELKPYCPGLHRDSPSSFNDDSWKGREEKKQAPIGRWPSNLILDEEAAHQLDQMTGDLKSGSGDKHNRKPSSFNASTNWESLKGTSIGGDSGRASRFFYCAKSSPSERNRGLEGMPLKETSGCYGEFEGDRRGRQTEHQPMANNHPTVKPIALMKYLLTLLAPPGNPLCLDPFSGSGSTLVAAKELGIRCIGIEKEAEYVEISKARIM